MPRRRGFSLVELLIALVVASVLAASVTNLFLVASRNVRKQTERARIDADIRQSLALLHAELKGLGGGDSASPNILAASSNSIIYRPSRTLRFLCRRADTTNATVTTWDLFWGAREIRPDLDSVRILVMTLQSEHWIDADVVEISSGICPGGAPGVQIRLAGPSAEQLAALIPGVPLVGGEVAELKSYPDARGQWWLGMRRYSKGARRWPSVQPILGPLAPDGLEISYLGPNGVSVTNHTDVIRIRVRIIHEAADPSARWEDRESVVDVALRGVQ